MKVLELDVPVILAVSLACQPSDQFPYNVILARSDGLVAEQLKVTVLSMDKFPEPG